mmetsp:Transcript_20950/g.46542  ORF Transcript_20950/g.46542 Transcript_20950/m.46542 type:complete len:393 (-) Transcript_20950:2107-3285(-)
MSKASAPSSSSLPLSNRLSAVWFCSSPLSMAAAFSTPASRDSLSIRESLFMRQLWHGNIAASLLRPGKNSSSILTSLSSCASMRREVAATTTWHWLLRSTFLSSSSFSMSWRNTVRGLATFPRPANSSALSPNLRNDAAPSMKSTLSASPLFITCATSIMSKKGGSASYTRRHTKGRPSSTKALASIVRALFPADREGTTHSAPTSSPGLSIRISNACSSAISRRNSSSFAACSLDMPAIPFQMKGSRVLCSSPRCIRRCTRLRSTLDSLLLRDAVRSMRLSTVLWSWRIRPLKTSTIQKGLGNTVEASSWCVCRCSACPLSTAALLVSRVAAPKYRSSPVSWKNLVATERVSSDAMPHSAPSAWYTSHVIQVRQESSPRLCISLRRMRSLA